MVVVWQTLANRRKRRRAQGVARGMGVKLEIVRACSTAVDTHIRALSTYLTSPSPDARRLVEEIERELHPAPHLPGYFVNAKLGRAPSEPAAGERMLYCTTRNLLTDTLEDQQFEFALVAGMSPGPVDPLEHVIVSLQEGEEPTPTQIEEMIDIMLAVTGMSRHQVFAVMHGDTDNRHLHLMINRVDPLTGERQGFGCGHVRGLDALHQAIAVMEHRQGWRVQEGAIYETTDAGTFDRETGTKVLDDKLRPCASAKGWRAIREARREDARERKLPASALRYELRTGRHSLHRCLLEQAAPVLREAGHWAEVHAGLAPLGMRWRVLAAGGAVILCGDRAVPASIAWGGASASKLQERLGDYAAPPPDLEVAGWVDRTFPERIAALEKDRRRRQIKAAQALASATASEAATAVGHAYHDAAEALGSEERGGGLNAARARIALAPDAGKAAIAELHARYRRRCAAWRKRLRSEDLPDDVFDEQDDHVVGALLVDVRGRSTELVAKAGPLFKVRPEGDEVRYFLRERLAFVEHHDRIDLHLVRSDDALREALLLGARKWGSVVVTGDRETLHRLARIAVQEGVDIANPTLQPLIAALRTKAAERTQACDDERVITAERAAEERRRSERQAHDVAVLGTYSSAFGDWYRNRNLGNTANGARALAIVSDPRLRLELEELESQRFAVALAIRSAAEWERRRRNRSSDPAVAADQTETRSMAEPDVSPDFARSGAARAGDEAGPASGKERRDRQLYWQSRADNPQQGLAERGFARSAAAFLADHARQILAAGGLREQLARQQARSGWTHEDHRRADAPTLQRSRADMPSLQDMLGDRHGGTAVFVLNEQQRAFKEQIDRTDTRRREEIDGSVQRALEQRAGGKSGPTPFAAGLLLRAVARLGTAATDQPARWGSIREQDEAEITVLRRSRNFADWYERARRADPALLRALRAVPAHDRTENRLGLVNLKRGRVNFAFHPDHLDGGEREGSPPRVLLKQALKRTDKMPLLRRSPDGTIGLYDEALLDAADHNYAALLLPDIQALLEVEWRVQQEKRGYLLWSIHDGTLQLKAKLYRERHDGSLRSIVSAVGSSVGETALPASLREDPAFYFEVVRAQAGVVNGKRIMQDNPAAAAWLRARDESAGPNITKLLADRVLQEAVEAEVVLRSMRHEEALALVRSASAALQKHAPELFRPSPAGPSPQPRWRGRPSGGNSVGGGR